MKFSELATYFEKLEVTSSRIELTSILSEMFKKVSADEIDKVAYLLQGRVVPFFEPIEMGMADKLVIQALVRSYGVEASSINKLNTQLGDLGLVAERFSKQQSANSKQLSISDVFDGLYKVATSSGEGSVEKKVATLAELLSHLDAKSAKHLIRITLAKLRLGIGDPTVLDALSLAKQGDKSARPALEEAYNKTSDLGQVAKIFCAGGLKAVEKVHLQVGKPVRPALAERLPNAEEVIKRVGGEFAAEPKYDGFRLGVHLDRKRSAESGNQVQFFSRNLENMTHMFPDLSAAVKKEVKADSTIFEGEAIAYNPLTEEFLPFQETTKRRRKYGIEEFAAKLPLKLFAFDLLYLDGKDITALPYEERRARLEKIIPNDGLVLVAQERVLHSADELREMFEEEISAGLEGVMVKKLDSPYKAGARGYHWIKFKRMAAGELTDTIDCVLLGVYTGTGKRTDFGAGGLLVGLYDDEKDEFVTVSRLGTGLTDEEWRQIFFTSQKIKVDHKPARVNSLITPSYWVEPKEVLEIFADEITRSPVHTAGKVGPPAGGEPGYALRFPRLVSFRGADKRAEDCTTVKELIEMYDQQKKVKVSP